MSRRGESGRTKLPIVVSQGEPSGIGPEVAVKAWSQLNGAVRGRPIELIGNTEVFRQAAAFAKIDARALDGAISDVDGTVRAEPGRPSPENAKAVTGAIERAVDACRSGKACGSE